MSDIDPTGKGREFAQELAGLNAQKTLAVNAFVAQRQRKNLEQPPLTVGEAIGLIAIVTPLIALVYYLSPEITNFFGQIAQSYQAFINNGGVAGILRQNLPSDFITTAQRMSPAAQRLAETSGGCNLPFICDLARALFARLP